MNNIPQKNILLRNNEQNVLPYGKTDVKFYNNQTINQINVNNSFQQLRDNDLYIENFLNCISNFQAGPEIFDENALSSNFLDGKKYWGGITDDTRLSILHKINKQPYETLLKTSITASVNYIIKYSEFFIVATQTGNLLTSIDGDEWGELSSNVSSLTFYKNDNGLFIGLNSDVAMANTNSVVSQETGETTTSIEFNKITYSGTLDGEYPTAINIDDNKNIFVGTDRGNIWKSHFETYQGISNLKFSKAMMNVEGCGPVNDFRFRTANNEIKQENITIATLSGAIAQQSYEKTYIDEEFYFEDVLREYDDGEKIFDLANLDDKIYVGFNNCISVLGEDVAYGGPGYDLETINNRIYFLTKVNEDTVVSCINNDESVTIPGKTPTCMKFVDDDVYGRICFIGTTSGLYFSVISSGTYKCMMEDSQVDEIEVNVVDGTPVVYVAHTGNDGTRYFTVYELTQVNGEWIHSKDTKTINGVKVQASAENTKLMPFLLYKKSAVYVDGLSILFVDGTDNTVLSAMDSNIVWWKRIQYDTGVFGIIVKCENENWVLISEDDTPIAYPLFFQSQDGLNVAPSDIFDITLSGGNACALVPTGIFALQYTQPTAEQQSFEFVPKSFTEKNFDGTEKIYDFSGDKLAFFENGKITECEIKEFYDFRKLTLSVSNEGDIFEIDSDICKIVDSGEFGLTFVVQRIPDGDTYKNSTELSILGKSTSQPGIYELSGIVNFDNPIQQVVFNRSTASLLCKTSDGYGHLVNATKEEPTVTDVKLPDDSNVAFYYNIPMAVGGDGISALLQQKSTIQYTTTFNIGEMMALDFNEFPNDDPEEQIGSCFIVADSDGISAVNNSSTKQLVGDGLSEATILQIWFAYASYKTTDSQCSTAVFGLSVFGVPEDYVKSKTVISDKYFNRIVPCKTDHVFLLNKSGIYIDDYGPADNYLKYEDDEGGGWLRTPVSGTVLQLYEPSEDVEVSGLIVDSTIESSDISTIGVIAAVGKSDELYFKYIQLSTEYEDAHLMSPAFDTVEPISGPFIIKNGELSVKIKNFALKTASRGQTYDMYILDDSGNLYHKETELDPHGIIDISGCIVLDNVDDLLKDYENGYLFYIKKNEETNYYDFYDVYTNDFLTSILDKNVFGVGIQQGPGFAWIGDGNEICSMRISDSEYQLRKVASTSATAMYSSNGITYILGDAETPIKYIKNGNLDNFDSRISTVSADGETITGISSATLLNDDLWYGNEETFIIHSLLYTGTTFSHGSSRIINQRNFAELGTLDNQLIMKTVSNGGVNWNILMSSTISVDTTTQKVLFDNLSSVVVDANQSYGISVDSGISSVVELSGYNAKSVITGEVGGLKSASGGIAFLSSDKCIFKQNEWMDVFPVNSVENACGFARVDSQTYVMFSNGVYVPEYQQEYNIISSSLHLSTEADIQQIKPLQYSHDAYLVSSMIKANEGKIQLYANYFHNSKTISPKIVNGYWVEEYTGASDDGESYGPSYYKQTFQKASFVRNTNKTIHFVDIGESQFYCDADSSQLNDWQIWDGIHNKLKFQKIFSLNNFYYVICNDRLWRFKRFDSNHLTFSTIYYKDGVNFGKFNDIDTNHYIIAATSEGEHSGIFNVKNNNIFGLSYPFNCTSIRTYSKNLSTTYYYAIDKDGGAQVQYQTNYKKINTDSPVYVDFSGFGEDIVVNDMLPINDYEFMFATTKGLFRTKYSYSMINDLTYFTEQDLNGIYRNLLSSSILDNIQNAVDEHESKWHTKNSIVETINNMIEDVDFSQTPAEWKHQTKDDEMLVVSNDVVFEMMFGDETTGSISVLTENFLKSDTPKFNYIVKRYTSGMTELYILLDTTNTYYINHIDGAGYSTPSNGQTRKNLEKFGYEKATPIFEEGDNQIDMLKTKISVVLNPDDFFIDGVADYQINGCSLPLEIYQDLDGSQYQSDYHITGMYQSLILPSKIKNAENGELVGMFEIAGEPTISVQYVTSECFGTDQQSIRLHFFDSKHIIDTNGFTIIFHGNGGYVDDDKTFTLYSQRFNIGDEKQLYGNRFASYFGDDGTIPKIFGGWSFTENSLDNEISNIHFTNLATVTDSIIIETRDVVGRGKVTNWFDNISRGTEVHFYAVWITYDFSEIDTSIKLNAGTNELNIGNFTINERTNLKKYIMVDFGTPK